MANLVGSLIEKNIPAPFAFMYDEFWLLFTKLNKITESTLGQGFFRLPDFWVWSIDPQKNQSGWKPHRDKGYLSLNEDGSPKSLTYWVPLTASTTLNGCMYILPADRDPTYGKDNDSEWKINLPDIRALPANAGSVFCWNQAVLHWGSHASSRGHAPRVSIAFEFQDRDTPPMNSPLMDPYSIPNFEYRLKLICKQILQYRHMYPLDSEIEQIALKILDK
jgi:ectoine hydroxylase-related dioxygenase (phytanoyl-CoA dioxygenase family)